MKPTLEDVAGVAGVSRATASRVINGSSRVSEQARLAVHSAVTHLGYVPNRAARSLVTQRTDSIALVVRETETTLFSEPFFAGIVRSINQRVVQSGLQMILVMAEPSREPSSLEQYLTGGHVDGVLLVSLHGDDELLGALVEAGVPTVIAGRSLGHRRVSSVDADNRGGARAAVEHLVAAGRRRVATITGPRDMVAGLDRFEGYLDGLRETGLPIDESLVIQADFSHRGGVEAARQLLDRAPDVDALFAASDLIAAGALQTFAANGRGVPDDIALVGFDDSSVAQLTDPSLTTVRQPLDAMGSLMCELLIEEIDEDRDGNRQEVLPTQLVVRASSSGVVEEG